MSTNPKYDEMKAKHPNWSDDQIWTAISLDMEADTIIDTRGTDVDINDPSIIEEIIIGAKQWLSDVLPKIYERVKTFFDKLLTTIATWVKKGLSYIADLIDTLFDNPADNMPPYII